MKCYAWCDNNNKLTKEDWAHHTATHLLLLLRCCCSGRNPCSLGRSSLELEALHRRPGGLVPLAHHLEAVLRAQRLARKKCRGELSLYLYPYHIAPPAVPASPPLHPTPSRPHTSSLPCPVPRLTVSSRSLPDSQSLEADPTFTSCTHMQKGGWSESAHKAGRSDANYSLLWPVSGGRDPSVLSCMMHARCMAYRVPHHHQALASQLGP